MQVRIATLKDREIIARFNQQMAQETENKVLPDNVINPGVTQLINSSNNGFYLVATDVATDTGANPSEEEKILGCLGITFEWSDWRNGLFWWIQSVYVDKSARRQGVFKSLYQTVSELAKKEGNVCGIRLYVEKDNTTAQQTYLNFGMIETEYRIMEVDWGSARSD
ncbi:MAG: GNAT family N-acetyltransferase [bacterium]|nr:N-acetyltransferase [Gammaproteobacteria bacterium]